MLTLLCTDRAQTKSFGWKMRFVPLALHTGLVRLIQRSGRGQENVPGLPKKDLEELAGCVAKVLERCTYFIRRRTPILFDEEE